MESADESKARSQNGPMLRFTTELWSGNGGVRSGDVDATETAAEASRLEVFKARFKVWIQSPINQLIVLWFALVVVSGAILFMVLTGMITFEDEHTKAVWDEVNSQILNGLFTLKALIVQPARLLALWKILSLGEHAHRRAWGQGDSHSTKQVSGSSHTRMEALVRSAKSLGRGLSRNDAIVFLLLLNINVWAQYSMAVFMYAYKHPGLSGSRPSRPPLGVALSLPISFLSEIVATIWEQCRKEKLPTDGGLSSSLTGSSGSVEQSNNLDDVAGTIREEKIGEKARTDLA